MGEAGVSEAEVSEAGVSEAGAEREPVVRILHRGPRYVVRHLQCSDAPWAVVSFEYWTPDPTLDGEFSAEGFLRHRRFNAFGVKAARNDWFLDNEIFDVIAAIRAASEGFTLVGYGGSMGGYAAINFSRDLGLHHVAVVIPQFSIDAAKAPYETRWRAEAAAIDFKHDKIRQIPPLTRGYAIFDPWCVDGQHMADIQRTHRLTEIRVPFGGHAIMLMLQQADVFTAMVDDMLADRFDMAAFRRSWRGARRQSSQFWLGIAEALVARRNAAGALRAIAMARALPHPDPAWFDPIEADARAMLGETAPDGAMAPAPAAKPPLWRRAARRLRRLGRRLTPTTTPHD